MTLDILDFIIDHENDWEEMISKPPYCITTKWDGNYCILTYDQFGSDFSIKMVRECRGIIFEKFTSCVISDDSIHPLYIPVCVPFFKFGNYGESYIPDIDWSTAEVQEKIDGSLIKLWYSHRDKEWKWSTNGTIDASKATLQKNDKYQTYMDLIKVAVNNDFSFLNSFCKTWTYMFELVSPYNKIVVPYSMTELRIIGARDTNSGEEQKQTDIVLQYALKKENYTYFDMPARYGLTTLEECLDAARKLPFDEEGYVVVDKNFNRVKIKSTEWVKASSMRFNGNVTYESVLKLVCIDKQDDFIQYFPEYEYLVNEVIADYNKAIADFDTLAHTILDVEGYRDKSRKELAERIKDFSTYHKFYIFERHGRDITPVKFFKLISLHRRMNLIASYHEKELG